MKTNKNDNSLPTQQQQQQPQQKKPYELRRALKLCGPQFFGTHRLICKLKELKMMSSKNRKKSKGI